MTQRAVFLVVGLWLAALFAALAVAFVPAARAGSQDYRAGKRVMVDLHCLPDKIDKKIPTSAGYPELRSALLQGDVNLAARVVASRETRCYTFSGLGRPRLRSVLIRHHETFAIGKSGRCITVWYMKDDYPGPKTYGFAFLPLKDCSGGTI